MSLFLQREVRSPYTSNDDNTLVRVSEELKTLLLKNFQALLAHLSDPIFSNAAMIFGSLLNRR